jgi:magnesium transporter
MLTFHPGHHPGEGPPPAGTVWIDLVNPTETEIQLVEGHTGYRIPTLADLREIERSSQLAVDGEVLRLSLPIVANADSDQPVRTHVGLIVSPALLVSVRFEALKVFEMVAERACPAGHDSSSAAVFTVLLEALVDRQADLLEREREHLDEISRSIFRAPAAGATDTVRSNASMRALLRRLGRIGERVSLIRDSMLATGRAAPFAVETAKAWIDGEHQARLVAVTQDVESLNMFEEHLSGKVQFLLDAALGLISIEQNDTFKVLTIASVVGIPPTLVAGWYGMNFHNMPELGWAHGYEFGIAMIVLSTVVPLAWFKWRGWM